AVVGGALQLAVDVVAPDHIEDHIDALAAARFLHRRDEILGLVVYGAVGAELRAGFAFLRAASRRKNLVAEGFHDLNRGDADSGGPSLHEEGLAGLDPGAIEDVAPHREEGLRERGGDRKSTRLNSSHGSNSYAVFVWTNK